jgi:hypothetical protein
MPKNAQKHGSQNIFPGSDYAGVWQDKIGTSSDQVASGRPERSKDEMRSAPGKASKQSACVPITAHVRPEIKAELQRLARQGRGKGEILSLSQTASSFLEKGIRGHIDMQYGALLKPVIEMVIKKGLQGYRDLTFNAYYSAEETRILVIQLLSIILGDRSDILPGIISESQKEALKNLKSQLLKDTEEGKE